jgi:sugar phosphate isomerase/epimerase
MERHWSQFLKLGIVHPMMFPQTIKGEGPMLETLGHVLMDPIWEIVAIRPPNDLSLREAMVAMLSQAHVQTAFVATMPMMAQDIRLSALDEPTRLAAVESTKKLVDEAYFFHCPTMMIASDKDPGPGLRDKARAALTRSIIELCRYARSKASNYTLKLVIENFDRDIEKKFLIGPTHEAVEIANEVCRETPNFGICLDTSHLTLLGETLAQAYQMAKPHVVEVHLANCTFRNPHDPLYGDNHPRFGYPGGEYDAPQVAACLRELFGVGYLDAKGERSKPPVIFEVKPAPGESSDMVLAGTKRVFMEAWAIL